MSRSLRIAATLSCSFLISAAALSAQIPMLTGEPFSISAAELKAASAAIPADRRFEAQVLLDDSTYRFADAGTLTLQRRVIFRVDSADGVRDWSEISADWDPWDQLPAQLHARVLQPDGRFVELDQKTITDAPVKADDSETFSSGHIRRAPLPGVTIGAIVEQVTVTEEKQPYFSGGELYQFRFRYGAPVARERLIVDLPRSLPYKDAVHLLPDVKIDRSEAAGRRHIVYEATNIKPLSNSDIDLDSNARRNSTVEFATGESWAAVASKYAALSDPNTVTADAREILPTELPADRGARLRVIVQRLHKEVRYTGVEFGAARLTPQRPSEVIHRHYGDCKDKATLLVAMLREAGIPANLALLSTGPSVDIDPDLPGMNQFDHAIVYVPAAGAQPALWIDATAEFYQVGTLPFADQDRSALVISPQTTALLKTPAATPADSVLIESRTFTLSGLGPAHIEELSETHGYVDANYRASYGGADTPKVHDELENYIRQAYLGKTLTAIRHSDGADLQQPFHLTLVVDGARRGFTDMNEAVAALFATTVANGLPKWFSTPPPVVGPESSPEDRVNIEIAQASRAESYTMHPFTTEQRIKILAPAGFTVRALPADRSTQLGSATLKETYRSTEPGIVTATFHFESGPATITVDQAIALRTAILEFEKREYVGVYFDQVGAKAMAAGRIREALEADRALIAAQPGTPLAASAPETPEAIAAALNHVRLARALLDAGIGDEAHAEARRATEIDPKSSAAFSALGWTLEHDGRGERFGKGYDRAGALAAFKQAIALDPEDNDPRFDLGILYEFNARGTRYAPDADMPLAAASYRELIERTKDKGANAATQFRENLLYVLLYSKQFAELDKLVASLPATKSHASLAIASAAAQHGAQAGIAQAEKGNVSAADRNKNLRSAGTQLANMHRYAEAADVLSAGMQGGEDAPTIARQVDLYRGLKAASLEPLPKTNPAAPVQLITIGMMDGTLTRDQAAAALSRHAYSSDAALDRDVRKNLASAGFMRAVAAKSDMTESVLLDLLGGNMTFTATGDDNAGYGVVAQMPGSEPSHYFLVHDDGTYRIVADEHDTTTVGIQTLYALDHKQPAEAKALLDWKRDLLHKGGGDDSFEGPLLPRFWTVGSSRPGADSPEAMRLAAISLLAGSMDARPYLAEIAAARVKATGQRQGDLDLLLALAGLGAEDPGVALTAAKRLLDAEPDSATAVRLVGASFAYTHDQAGWQAMLTPRLAKKPKDHDLLTEQARAYEFARDFAAAQATQQKILDSGKAESGDYNSYAWLGLFTAKLGDDATKAAQQANMLSKNGSFADLHTMACVYAAQGKTTEARQVLAQAMYAGSQSEPNSEVWYALGLIYEQYGARTAALDAYHRVEAHELDDHTFVDPISTYNLAQARIAALKP